MVLVHTVAVSNTIYRTFQARELHLLELTVRRYDIMQA
jgi:hypothetical protein